MIPVPNFLFRILCAIPLVGHAFRRGDHALIFTENHVEIPLFRFFEGAIRTLPYIALIVAIFYLINQVNSKKVVISDTELASSMELETDEFNEVLQECETDLLVDFLDTIQDDSSDDIESRVSQFEKKILVAKRIAKSRLRSNQWYGISKELEIRSNLAMICLENKFFDVTLQNELLELSDLYKNIQFPESTKENRELVEWAKFADITAFVVDSIESGNKSIDAGVVEALRNKGDSFSGEMFTKTGIDKRLLELARVAELRLSNSDIPTEIVDVLQKMASGISTENEVVQMQELAALDCRNSVASSIPYRSADSTSNEGIESAIFSDAYVRKFNEKLGLVLENDRIESEDLKVILSKLNQISVSGWPQEAQVLSEKLLKHLASSAEQHPEISAETKRFLKLLDWGGEEFLLDGIETLDKKPAKFHASQSDATVLILISMENIGESNARFKEIVSVLNKLSQSKAKNHLGIVFMHDKDKLNGLPNMRKTAEAVPALMVWQLDINSDRGKAITEIFELETLPFVVVLDADKKVVGFDPKRMHLESIVNKLKTSN